MASAGEWSWTARAAPFQAAVAGLLARAPEQCTVTASVLANLLAGAAFGPDEPLLGWWTEPEGSVTGALFWTPPFAATIELAPAAAATAAASQLARLPRPPVRAGLPDDLVAAFTAGWPGPVQVAMHQRLYRLSTLSPVQPGPAGSARVAQQHDLDLVDEWYLAFAAEIGEPAAAGPQRAVLRRLLARNVGAGRVTLWQVAGEPVALAAHSPAAAGVVRVGPVYTLPHHRGRGYGTAVTAGATAGALAAGAKGVVLFTDLANPTSNSIYQRIGYRAVHDRTMLDIGPAEVGGG